MPIDFTYFFEKLKISIFTRYHFGKMHGFHLARYSISLLDPMQQNQ